MNIEEMDKEIAELRIEIRHFKFLHQKRTFFKKVLFYSKSYLNTYLIKVLKLKHTSKYHVLYTLFQNYQLQPQKHNDLQL